MVSEDAERARGWDGELDVLLAEELEDSGIVPDQLRIRLKDRNLPSQVSVTQKWTDAWMCSRWEGQSMQLGTRAHRCQSRDPLR